MLEDFIYATLMIQGKVLLLLTHAIVRVTVTSRDFKIIFRAYKTQKTHKVCGQFQAKSTQFGQKSDHTRLGFD
jgi:hypothetical protein